MLLPTQNVFFWVTIVYTVLLSLFFSPQLFYNQIQMNSLCKYQQRENPEELMFMYNKHKIYKKYI